MTRQERIMLGLFAIVCLLSVVIVFIEPDTAVNFAVLYGVSLLLLGLSWLKDGAS